MSIFFYPFPKCSACAKPGAGNYIQNFCLGHPVAKIDISVFKLHRFETFEGLGFGEFDLEKKSRFQVGRKKNVSVSENLVSEKSIGFGFGNLVSEKSIGIGQNFGIVIQCPVDGNVPSFMT